MPDIKSFLDATHVKQVLPFLKLIKKPRNYMQFKNITNEKKLQEKKNLLTYVVSYCYHHSLPH